MSSEGGRLTPHKSHHILQSSRLSILMSAPVLSIIHIVCFAPRTPVTHLSSDRFTLSLWNISLTLDRRRTICSSFFPFFFFFLGDFILKKFGLGRVVLWALSCLSFLKTNSFHMCFPGQPVLTFELSLVAVALQCPTDDYSPLSLPKCMEESMVFTEALMSAWSSLTCTLLDHLPSLSAFGLTQYCLCKTLKKK